MPQQRALAPGQRPPPVRVAAVSYLNAQPLVRGLEHCLGDEIELTLDFPARLPGLLSSGAVQLALLPVAALPGIPGAKVAIDYGIAADGPVASVALFSRVPMADIEEVVLDYQSRTSVALVRLLLRDFWCKKVRFIAATPDYIAQLGGARAGVIIGDRALQETAHFAWHWDLAAAWKAWTGLPFVFAAWTCTSPLPALFMARFEAANEYGLEHIADVVAAHRALPFDVAGYFRDNLRFRLDARMREGLDLFLDRICSLPSV